MTNKISIARFNQNQPCLLKKTLKCIEKLWTPLAHITSNNFIKSKTDLLEYGWEPDKAFGAFFYCAVANVSRYVIFTSANDSCNRRNFCLITSRLNFLLEQGA